MEKPRKRASEARTPPDDPSAASSNGTGRARGTPPTAPALGGLEAAAADWRRGRGESLRRWLDREIGADGLPVRLAVPEWIACLDVLERVRQEDEPAWPAEFDARIERFFVQVLRFCRPGGAPVFGPPVPDRGTGGLLGRWADRLAEPGLRTVVDWWFPSRTRRHAAPPLPASAHPDIPLAILRADWTRTGDFLAIDHRDPGATSRLELFGLGQTWLGACWAAGTGDRPAAARPARSRMVRWESNSSADVAEWAFTAGGLRVVRSAVLLRGRRLALLADQAEGPDPLLVTRFSVPEPLSAEPADGDRSIRLSSGPRRPNATVVPLGLPFRSQPADRGSFHVEGRELVLHQRKQEKRAWSAVLVSWDALRHRKSLIWRSLTVTQRGRICAPDEAVAYRVAWGRDDSLVIYRSLGPAAPRAFLGHQTEARMLIGLFNRDGEVEPILKLGD